VKIDKLALYLPNLNTNTKSTTAKYRLLDLFAASLYTFCRFLNYSLLISYYFSFSSISLDSILLVYKVLINSSSSKIFPYASDSIFKILFSVAVYLFLFSKNSLTFFYLYSSLFGSSIFTTILSI